MSDHTPKPSGGFLTGFLTGSAVSVAAICASWVFLPISEVSRASVGAEDEAAPNLPEISQAAEVVSPEAPSPETSDVAPSVEAASDRPQPVETAPLGGSEVASAAGSDDVGEVGGAALERPSVQSAPSLPNVAGADQLPNIGSGVDDNLPSRSADASGGSSSGAPQTTASSDRLALPELPQDQGVPAFPSTTVPARAPFEGAEDAELNASLPATDEALNEAPSAEVPEADAASLPQDQNTFDTASARVGTSAVVPERSAAPAAQTMTIVPIAAPNPPRLPRATLSTPQSSFSAPVSLTLPNVDRTPAEGPPPKIAQTNAPGDADGAGLDDATAQNDTAEGAAPGTELVDVPQAPQLGGAEIPEDEDPGSFQVARLDQTLPERETVGSLIQNRDAPEVSEPAQPELLDLSGPAFVVNAAEFSEGDGGARLAIILEDVGEAGISRDELVGLGTRVTFAIRPDRTDAAEAQAAYRAAGFEVVVLVPEEGDMHIGAATQPARASVSTAAMLSRVPGAVGMIDNPNGNISRNARLVAELAETLNETGHGFLVHEQFGVNRTIDALRERSVPSASILRVIDGQKNQEAIRRSLDIAALEAGKSGGAVVFGRTYPETISALGIWSLSRSARSVQFAPVTATIGNLE